MLLQYNIALVEGSGEGKNIRLLLFSDVTRDHVSSGQVIRPIYYVENTKHSRENNPKEKKESCWLVFTGGVALINTWL